MRGPLLESVHRRNPTNHSTVEAHNESIPSSRNGRRCAGQPTRCRADRAQREGTPNVEARLGAPDDPKLAAASVDRVLIVDTWHHIDDRVAYSKKLAAALKPGGAVFVVDFTLETEKGPPRQHRLAPAQVIEELTQAGMKAAVADTALPDQYIVNASL